MVKLRWHEPSRVLGGTVNHVGFGDGRGLVIRQEMGLERLKYLMSGEGCHLLCMTSQWQIPLTVSIFGHPEVRRISYRWVEPVTVYIVHHLGVRKSSRFTLDETAHVPPCMLLECMQTILICNSSLEQQCYTFLKYTLTTNLHNIILFQRNNKAVSLVILSS